MDNVKDDYYYVKRLLRSIIITCRYLENRSMEDLLSDGYLCDAIENRFTKMAEDMGKLSQDFKKSISTAAWNAVPAIRNRVCHDYDVVDATILYKTIKVNLPEFKDVLLKSVKINRMSLFSEPFDLLKNKKKTVEMRLYDEKRKKFNIGELILFTNNESKEELLAEIIDLKRFKSFIELYSRYKKEELGYSQDSIAKPEDMLAYYSKENIDKFGVIAIEIKTY